MVECVIILSFFLFWLLLFELFHLSKCSSTDYQVNCLRLHIHSLISSRRVKTSKHIYTHINTEKGRERERERTRETEQESKGQRQQKAAYCTCEKEGIELREKEHEKKCVRNNSNHNYEKKKKLNV